MKKMILLTCLLSLNAFAGRPNPMVQDAGDIWKSRTVLTALPAEQIAQLENDLKERKSPALPLASYRFVQYEPTVEGHGIVMYLAHETAVCEDGTIDQDSYMALLYVKGETINSSSFSANFGCHQD